MSIQKMRNFARKFRFPRRGDLWSPVSSAHRGTKREGNPLPYKAVWYFRCTRRGRRPRLPVINAYRDTKTQGTRRCPTRRKEKGAYHTRPWGCRYRSVFAIQSFQT